MEEFRIFDLRCEYLNNPLGLDVIQPRLSWKIDSARRGARQTGYQIQVASSPELLSDGQPDLWDSLQVGSPASLHVPYRGKPLHSSQRAWWRVRLWDEAGQPTAWSEPAWWEMGLLKASDWIASWIGGNLVGGARASIPSPYLRRAFRASEVPTSARLYLTALGVYEAWLNGQPVGDDVLSPGWTDYRKRVRYQTYDVTSLLKPGENVLGVILGDGWYCGHLGWQDRQFYGDRPRLLAQLSLTMPDGTQFVLTSDRSWRVAYGALLASDLLMGESYDARLEFSGWSSPGYDDAAWQPVQLFPDPGIILQAYASPPVRRIQEIMPVGEPAEISGWPRSRWIYDFGQNLTGRVRLRLSAPAGTTVHLRHAEVLDDQGKLYTANLRSARQEDHYSFRGEGLETYEPHFTFHGFRYVELSGYPGKPGPEALTAIVLHSDLLPTGEFECSEPLLNQLQHNIQWGQKGNFLDVPTDCPQRDERLGWTGDAQVFARTAAFNLQVAPFFAKWQQDLEDAQVETGSIPPIAPFTDLDRLADGGPAWADAVVICPWTMYLSYADRTLIQRFYPSFVRYLAYLQGSSLDLIRSHPDKDAWGGFGDWLALDGSGKTEGGTSKDLIGTAFFAYSAHLVAEIATALGKHADAVHYIELFRQVRQAFIHRFVTPAGLLTSRTQTACVLALHFDLLPEDARPEVFKHLVRDIENRGDHLSTGFVGTPYLLHVLTREGRLDLAYALLLQKSWPSWLYPVTQGATTIWERWDGWSKERGFQDPGMNSFNHYAYGSVGDWLYQFVAGIQVDPALPGYQHILFKPQPGGGLTAARAAYESLYGRVVSDWHMQDGRFTWQVILPPNSLATVWLPALPEQVARESGLPLDQAQGVSVERQEATCRVLSLQSGEYHFLVD